MTDVLFRDESERIVRRVRVLNGDMHEPPLSALSTSSTSASPSTAVISHSLSQPVTELAANFFFSKYYACDGPPPPDGFPHWLAQSYCHLAPSHALRAVIEATGMAGISNVHNAPELASRSKQQYGRALESLQRALSDPVEAMADTTLVTVSLFGLFEVTSGSPHHTTRLISSHHTVHHLRRLGPLPGLDCPYSRRHCPSAASRSETVR